MTLVSSASKGGAITTRTLIPHRCHASIGVLGAVSVATACMLPDSVAAIDANVSQADSQGNRSLSIEHPIGETSVVMNLAIIDGDIRIGKAAILRTARKLFDGLVYAWTKTTRDN